MSSLTKTKEPEMSVETGVVPVDDVGVGTARHVLC